MFNTKARNVLLRNGEEPSGHGFRVYEEERGERIRKIPPLGDFPYPQNSIPSVTYLTASFSAFAARNLGTFIAATCTVAPVRGLRAWRASRRLTEKMPRPAMETSSLFLSEPTIESITLSTTASACTLVVPSTSCTASAMPCLFIGEHTNIRMIRIYK